MTMLGADVGGLERAGRKCLDAAQTADQVAQVMQALVMALRAAQAFTGPWAEALINFLTNVVIPWLRRIAQALRLFGKVLNGNAQAQRRVSAGLPVDFSRLPTYPAPQLPPADPAAAPAEPEWAEVTPPDPDLPDAAPAPDPAPGEAEPETFDTPPLATPADQAATPAPPTGGGWGGGGGGGSRISAPDVPELPEPADPPPVTEPEPAAPDADQTAPAATVTAATTPGGRGISGGQVAGLGATAAGAGLLGGAAALVAARRRALQTDGSEVLGSSSLDRPAGSAPRRGVATLADTRQSSRTGAPAGSSTDTDRGAGTDERRSS